MYIFKKAFPLLVLIGIMLLAVNYLLSLFNFKIEIQRLLISVSIMLYVFIIFFFRIPKRLFIPDGNIINSPADGTIIAIEKVFEDEYLKMDCMKISIFMSVFNVHQNRVPVSGRVVYSKHNPGNYFVAWHPKSSLKNERNTIVIETSGGHQILVRQIAGIIARRIICSLKEGDIVKQGDELGFIMFGSRVDLFILEEMNILVKLGSKVKANRDVIAQFGFR